MLRSGDRIVGANQVYGDTRDALVRDLLARGLQASQLRLLRSTSTARELAPALAGRDDAANTWHMITVDCRQ